jgi:predicted DNA-binding transcriptional regulator AlpA
MMESIAQPSTDIRRLAFATRSFSTWLAESTATALETPRLRRTKHGTNCRYPARYDSLDYAPVGLWSRWPEAIWTPRHTREPAMLHAEQEDSQSMRRTLPMMPAFYRIAEVMRITALSRATLYRRIADGRFPQPVHLGGRACGWTPASLQTWIDDPQGYTATQPRQAGRPHSSTHSPS